MIRGLRTVGSPVPGRQVASPPRRGRHRNPALVLDGDQAARQRVAVGESDVLGRRPDHNAVLGLEQPGPRSGREAGERGECRAGDGADRVHVEPAGEPVRIGGDRVAVEIRGASHPGSSVALAVVQFTVSALETRSRRTRPAGSLASATEEVASPAPDWVWAKVAIRTWPCHSVVSLETTGWAP